MRTLSSPSRKRPSQQRLSDHPCHRRLKVDPHLRRRRSAPATTESTTELRRKAARGIALLALVTATVAALAVGAAGRAARGPVAVAAEHAARGRVRALLLDVRRGDNLRGQVQPLAQVVETLGRQRVVVPLPAELRLEVASRGQGLCGFDDLRMCVSF